MSEREYTQLRDAYWSAQEEFRRAAIRRIIELMPDDVHTIVVAMSDGPYAVSTDFLGADGKALDDWDEDFESQVDQILRDMEAFSAEEADSYLSRGDDGWHWRITREDA